MTFRSLLRSRLLLVPVLLTTACGGEPPEERGFTAGPDQTELPPEEVRISVWGTAEVFPPARAWLEAAGQRVPSLEGLRLRLEEPLLGLLVDGQATYGEVPLAATGTFRVDQVPTARLTLGMAAAVEDPAVGAPARVVRSTTLLFDTTREGRLPVLDLREARAFALPVPYVDALQRAVGLGRVQAVAPGAQSLTDAGFVLGRVVDASGSPVAGARLTVAPAELQGRLFYPSEDLASAGQEGTSPSGLFVLVHDGGDVRTWGLTVDGRTDYPPHGAASGRGTALVLTVAPDRP
jgi:hypothetical protein